MGDPSVDRLTIEGPFARDRLRRYRLSPQDLRLPTPTGRPGSGRSRARAPRGSCRRWPGWPTAGPWTRRRVDTLMDFYRRGRAGVTGGSAFDRGIESALQFILASPEFLVRFEADPPNLASNAAYRLDDLALASRLSFFLWSSLPDDQLLTLASQGKLKDPVGARTAGQADAGRRAIEGAGHQLRRAVAAPAQSQELRSGSGSVPRFRRQPPAGDEGRDRRCSSTASCAKTAASWIC